MKLILLRFIFKQHYLLMLLLFLCVNISSFADNGDDCVKIKNKKATKLYESALEQLRFDQKKAYEILKQVVEIEPNYVDAYYVMGDMFYRKATKANSEGTMTRYYKKSVKNFNMVIGLCPSFLNYSAYFFTGEYYYGINEYKKAKEYLDVFVDKNSNSKINLDKAYRMLKTINAYLSLINNPVPFNPKPLTGVSTGDQEYLPMVSPDGELFFFTHQYDKELKSSVVSKKRVEEFSFSKRIEDSSSDNIQYSSGEPMPEPFNMGMNQGGVSISIDNNHIYITICKMSKGGYKNCDIYSSDFVDDKWTELKNLGPNVNGSNSWESQPSIAADGKTLFFASIRPSNIGFDFNNQTIDIYKSTLKNGVWSKAVNLGPSINTKGNDKSPFMHSDSQTLYFSSDSRVGIGKFDIYYAREENGKWKNPTNIGYPINTTEDDLGFIVSTNGKTAYFSSKKLKGNGGWDIYSFPLYTEARPEKVTFIKGYLKNEDGEALTNAKIELKSATTSKVIEGMVDKKTGQYAVAVAAKKDEEFIMTVKKKGYTFTSQYIKPKEINLDKPVKVNLEAKPIKVGEKVKLNDIYFETNRAVFDKASMVVLNNFIEFLEENPNVKFSINGHTDNIGNANSNLKLSKNRAKAVHDYLLLMGINRDRMSYKGYGLTRPVATNTTEQGRAKNRRTEFEIISK